ncbi:unnamed protein product [Orchesella dallaii]|uniref:Uncharacterized protein n=1 Tax=Orchesella dallaii TaxID=48710 RepID=A0ABP1QC89_9HEXA
MAKWHREIVLRTSGYREEKVFPPPVSLLYNSSWGLYYSIMEGFHTSINPILQQHSKGCNSRRIAIGCSTIILKKSFIVPFLVRYILSFYRVGGMAMIWLMLERANASDLIYRFFGSSFS